MKIDIQKERETPLLGRKRITAVIENEGPTPSRLDLQDALAKQLKAKRDLVIIKHVYSRFGEQNVKVIAHVYDKPENLSVVENKYVQKKK